MNRSLTFLLVTWLLLSGLSSPAAEPLSGPPPLPRPFDLLILPEVNFRDCDLIGALTYLQRKAHQHSQGKLSVPFVVDLPEDFRPRYELTLDLKSIPLAQALRYLGDQAGVEFSPEAGAVIVRRLGSAAARQAAPPETKRRAATGTPSNGSLNKPAEAVTTGNYIHRSTAGVIQPEKSTYLPHRSVSGWDVNLDPKNRTGVNCINPAVCPVGQCGCSWCACRPRKP